MHRRCAFRRLRHNGRASYGDAMERPKLESELVRLVMPDAPVAEIEHATSRWFTFLQILNEIAEERRRARDSRGSAQGDTFEKIDL